MKAFLKKLNIIDNLQTELEIQKIDFVGTLRKHVDEDSTGIFSDMSDAFSSSKNEYKGAVTMNGFKIKRRRKFFDMNMNMAVAKGTYTQHGDKLIIDTEINGFHNMMIPFYIFCIIIYAVFIVGFMFGEGAPLFALPFLLIHGAFMMGIPYFIMRRSTKRLKYELEREFFYFTK